MAGSTSGPIGEMFGEPSALSVVTIPSKIMASKRDRHVQEGRGWNKGFGKFLIHRRNGFGDRGTRHLQKASKQRIADARQNRFRMKLDADHRPFVVPNR